MPGVILCTWIPLERRGVPAGRLARQARGLYVHVEDYKVMENEQRVAW